jgi:hypothetical protein
VEIGAREVHIIGTKGGQLRTLAAVPGGKTATLDLPSLRLKWRATSDQEETYVYAIAL